MSTELIKEKTTKTTGRRYRSVVEMIKKEDLGPDVQNEYSKAEKETGLCRLLAEARLKAGFTQDAFAKKIGHTQSMVSKCEAGPDSELTIEIIEQYAKITNGQIMLLFGKEMNHVEAVKCHAFEIKRHLSALAVLANEEVEMEKEIQAFFGEAFFNILSILARCQQQMPRTHEDSRMKAFYTGATTSNSCFKADNIAAVV